MVYEKLAQYGPLPLRILAGISFIIHGLPKLSNISGTEHFFSSMIGLPAAMALPIGLLEVIGGIAILAKDENMITSEVKHGRSIIITPFRGAIHKRLKITLLVVVDSANNLERCQH